MTLPANSRAVDSAGGVPRRVPVEGGPLEGQRSSCSVRVNVLLVLAVALIVVPGGFGSPMGGPPLGSAGRTALCLVFAAWMFTQFFPPRRGPDWRVHSVVLLLLAVKVVLGTLSIPFGWHGQYHFVDQRGRPHTAEFFWRFKSYDFRIDQTLGFDQENFNLHFLNDVELFGYPPYSATRREVEFPISVDWTGYFRLDRGDRVAVAAVANGTLQVHVNGVDLEYAGDRWLANLSAGTHVLEVRYEKPAGVTPRVVVDVTNARTGVPVAMTAEPVSWNSPRPFARSTSACVWAGIAVALVALAFVTYRTPPHIQPRSIIARSCAFAVAGLLTLWTAGVAVRAIGMTAFLHPGGDPLLYASDARDILLHGVLMLRGQPLGQAAPFYFYPLYPYVLAVMHALIGDDISTVFLLNGLCVTLLPLLFWRLGWERMAPVAAAIGFVGLLAFIARYYWPIVTFEQPSFTDLLFLPIVFGAVIGLATVCQTPRPLLLVLAGVLAGLGAATRPSFLTFIGLAPIGLWFALRAPRRWAVAAAWFAGGVFLGLLPFTLRNLVASGRFVVLVNSWIQLPYFLISPEVPDKPGGIPAFGEAVRMARDIFVRDPWGTLWVEVRKVLFTFGLASFGPQGMDGNTALTILPPLAVLSAWLRCMPVAPAIAVATFAVSHVVAMVLAAPWTFHLKTILPLHAAFLFAAVYLLDDGRRSRQLPCGTNEKSA